MFDTLSLLNIPHLPEIALILNIVFCLWVIYLGGAELLEDTVLGYMEFGFFGGQKASTIRFLARCAIVGSVVGLVFRLFAH